MAVLIPTILVTGDPMKALNPGLFINRCQDCRKLFQLLIIFVLIEII